MSTKRRATNVSAITVVTSGKRNRKPPAAYKPRVAGLEINFKPVVYNPLNLSDLCGQTISVRVPTRVNLETVLEKLSFRLGLRIVKSDVEYVKIPHLHRGQSSLIRITAKADNTTYRGSATIKLIHEDSA